MKTYHAQQRHVSSSPPLQHLTPGKSNKSAVFENAHVKTVFTLAYALNNEKRQSEDSDNTKVGNAPTETIARKEEHP